MTRWERTGSTHKLLELLDFLVQFLERLFHICHQNFLQLELLLCAERSTVLVSFSVPPRARRHALDYIQGLLVYGGGELLYRFEGILTVFKQLLLLSLELL